MNENIIVEYAPEKKDYIQASRLLAMKTPVFAILAGIVLAALAAAVVILLIPSLWHTVWVNIATVVLIVCAFYILYYFVLIPYQLTRSYNQNESLKMIRRFTFSDRHVVMEVGENSSILPWEKFTKVLDGKEIYLMVYLGENRIYPLIPKRSLTDPSAEDALISLIKSKSILVV